MADLTFLGNFNAHNEPEMGEFSAIPEGKYVAVATSSETKPTKAGTGEYLQFQFEVLDGPYKGRLLWTRLNLKNPNEKAVDMARRELASFCRAVGVIQPRESAELHNRPVLLTVEAQIDDRKREVNIIKKFEPVTPGAQGAATTQTNTQPPAQQNAGYQPWAQ